MRCLVLSLLLYSAGCVQSLQPIVPQDAAESDERICGTWHSPNGQAKMFIAKTPLWPKTYSVVAEAKDSGTHHYRLQLTSFRDQCYFQLVSAGSVAPFTVSIYQIGRYSFNNDHLTISLVGGSKFQDALKRQKISHVERDNYCVLTADSSVLLQFLDEEGDNVFPSDLEVKYVRQSIDQGRVTK